MPKKDEATAVVEAMEPEEFKIVRVCSTLPAKPDGGFEIVLFERHPAHPGQSAEGGPVGVGEVYIAGPAPVMAAMTPEVSKLLRDRKIKEV